MKTKAHIRYKLKDGTIVPGATTVLNILNKPALVIWANKLGLQGIDSAKYRDETAEIGKLAHQMILDHFNNETTDTTDYSKEQIDKAENCLLSFFEWLKGHKLEVQSVEEPLVSEIFGYGGTIDCLCLLDGVPTLLDFKTGKAIYPEMLYQLAAYRELIKECLPNNSPKQCRILRIGRTEDEGFEERTITDTFKHFEIFQHCLHIYNLQKELKK